MNVNAITFYDWQRDTVHTGYICPLCGNVVGKRKRLTKDHVVPMSICSSTQLDFGIQRLCCRCNGLKADLLPTAWVYKLVRAARFLEQQAEHFHVNSIKKNRNNSAVYKVSFEGKVGFYSMESTGKILLYAPRSKQEFWGPQKICMVQRVLSDILLDNNTSIDISLLDNV